MPDISQITLPSGTTYSIRDDEARRAILDGFNPVICTNAADTPKDVQWKSGSTTITGTLVASASTKGRLYCVPLDQSSAQTHNKYAEYMTVEKSGLYTWEEWGTGEINLDNLGDLAYKDTAAGSFTPEGSVSKPNITVTKSESEKYVAESSTGGGSVVPGSVSPGSAAQCTFPQLTMAVTNRTLIFGWQAGSFVPNTPTGVTLPNVTMPTFAKQKFMTGATAALDAAPAFTGTPGQVNVS